MKKIIVKIVREKNVKLPQYETSGAAGMDICANIVNPITIDSLERILIPTGIKIEIPEGYEIQVRPRSGLAIKHGLTFLNTPGTIDSDYRGEIKVILANMSKEPYILQPGERIGQIILNKVEQICWEEVEKLEATERGSQGFGHTGK